MAACRELALNLNLEPEMMNHSPLSLIGARLKPLALQVIAISIIAMPNIANATATYIPSQQKQSTFSGKSDFTADATDGCSTLEQAHNDSVRRKQNEIINSDPFKAVQDARETAFDCQKSIAGELSTWVKGATGFGFVDKMLSDMSSNMTRQMCDQIKQQVRTATADVRRAESMIGNLPTSAEDLSKVGDLLGERAAQEAQRRATQAINEQIQDVKKDLPKIPRIPVPEAVQAIPGNVSQDPWSAIRGALGAN